MFPIPHGVACARLLPPVVEINVRALRARAATSAALARHDEVARIVTGRSDAQAEDGVSWLRELGDDLAVPGISVYGVQEDDIPRIAAAARRASSMQGNPVVLTDEELGEALRFAL